MKDFTLYDAATTVGSHSLRGLRRPTLAFDFDLSGPLIEPFLQQVNEEGWGLVCLRLTRGVLPKDPAPFAAVVKYPPLDPRLASLIASGCPVIRIGNYPHHADSKIPAVVPDKAAEGRLAAEHFAERGFRHLAFIGPKPWGFVPFFFDAMRKRGEELGCEMHLHQFDPSDEHDERPSVFEARVTELSVWLKALPKPVGLIAYTTRQSTMIYHACLKAGLLVPEQVAILADIETRYVCELSPVPLSYIESDYGEIIHQTIKLLRCIRAGEVTKRDHAVFVPPKGIVTRRSTDILAISDPMVAKALRFIWDNFDHYITVTDVATQMGVPRRRLERVFSKHLNRGIGEELRRKRLERCCELLRTTDLTVTDIVPQLGLRSKDYLHRFFREATGMTPRAYRLQFR
jgi:LacI family transcriptional regulator